MKNAVVMRSESKFFEIKIDNLSYYRKFELHGVERKYFLLLVAQHSINIIKKALSCNNYSGDSGGGV